MKVRIFEEDTWKEMANKIYDDFEVFQNCSVNGFLYDAGGRPHIKGELVCNELRRMDSLDNVREHGKRSIRKSKRLPNSIGGFVAHKMFRYEKVEDDNQIKYRIWRVQ